LYLLGTEYCFLSFLSTLLDIPPNPADVTLLGTVAVMPGPRKVLQAIEELALRWQFGHGVLLNGITLIYRGRILSK
jgi:hypothetical protein